MYHFYVHLLPRCNLDNDTIIKDDSENVFCLSKMLAENEFVAISFYEKWGQKVKVVTFTNVLWIGSALLWLLLELW